MLLIKNKFYIPFRGKLLTLLYTYRISYLTLERFFNIFYLKMKIRGIKNKCKSVFQIYVLFQCVPYIRSAVKLFIKTI